MADLLLTINILKNCLFKGRSTYIFRLPTLGFKNDLIHNSNWLFHYTAGAELRRMKDSGFPPANQNVNRGFVQPHLESEALTELYR